MMSTSVVFASLALVASTFAVPITSRDANGGLTKCGQTFGKTNDHLSVACSLLELGVPGPINPELVSLGQAACANATTVAIAAITVDCGTPAKAKRASESSAQTCFEDFDQGFRSFVSACGGDPDEDPDVANGLTDSAACDAAKTSTLTTIASACPAPAADAGDVSSVLTDAAAAGGAAGTIANAAQVLSDNANRAQSLGPGDCGDALLSAFDGVDAACGFTPAQPEVAAFAKKTCDQATTAVLNTISVPCSLANIPSANLDSFNAGVAAGQGKSCHDGAEAAFDLFNDPCLGDDSVPDSTDCLQAEAKAAGIFSVACAASN